MLCRPVVVTDTVPRHSGALEVGLMWMPGCPVSIVVGCWGYSPSRSFVIVVNLGGVWNGLV